MTLVASCQAGYIGALGGHGYAAPAISTVSLAAPTYLKAAPTIVKAAAPAVVDYFVSFRFKTTHILTNIFISYSILSLWKLHRYSSYAAIRI